MTKEDHSGPAAGTAHKLSFIGFIVSLGIVYGDIGTSPLYAMKAIVSATHHLTAEYVIGAVSCIIWTLTLQTTLKYVVLALRADNRGEGGILALFALVRRRGPVWLYLAAIIGASTLIADGVITPSITVLSAVEGLQNIHPETPVLPIAITILTILFFVQQYGTKTIGKLFGPIMLLWFGLLGALGLASLPHSWHILQALSPIHAINLLTNDPEWFLILGAVFLCTTGAEALYSDLGHCGKQNIRVSWVFVKSMLILNYLGQGAWLLSQTQDQMAEGINPFFAIMPKPLLPIGVIMATLAAIVASQALISGSFTIFSEAMNLHFWPRQRIKYPTNMKGQLYIPFVNWSLFVLCIIMAASFGSSGDMEAAYGLSITITMLMTTLLLTAYMWQQKTAPFIVIPIVCFFVALEGIFLLANMAKFMHGGWVTLLMAGAICIVMYIWYNAHIIRNDFVKREDLRPYFPIISDIKADTTIRKFATNVVYLSKLSGKYDVEQKVIYSIINKRPMRADHYILLHVDYQDNPDTLEYDFYTLIPNTLYRINIRLGFRVQPRVNVYLRQVIEDQVKLGKFSLASGYASLKKHGVSGNFVFMVINRIYADYGLLTAKKKFVMNASTVLSFLRQSIQAAMGLDTSTVITENVPMAIKIGKVDRVKMHINE